MNVTKHEAIVMGAGVAGLSTALYLQRAGLKVAVLDPQASSGGASYGNAGLITADSATPSSLPRMLRKAPGWLASRKAPLVVRPGYLARALPWLARWIQSGRLQRVTEISDAMRALHRDAFACWEELVGRELFSELIRRTGQVQVWEGDREVHAERIERELRDRHGIEAHVLGADDLRGMFPGIARDIKRGLMVQGNGYTTNPSRLVGALADLFRSAGGVIAAEHAMALIPQEGGAGYVVMTNVGNHAAGRVVLATGAWSGELLAPLGVRVPLESERGYHAMLNDANIELSHPISLATRSMTMTPMEHGLRLAGTSEIAGLTAAPDDRRARILVEHARRLFPDLASGEPQIWMGHRPSTPDSLPILGEVPGRPGLFLAFGHGHFGMTSAPPSARLVARLVAGQAPGIDPAPYSVRRFMH